MNIQKVRTLEMTDTMTGNIITDFNTQVTDPDANVASYGLTKGINDNLALKQPLSDILTQLVNSQIKHYKVTRHISSISGLRSFLEDARIGEGIELVSFKAPPDGRQSGFMITTAASSKYYAGIFFGYYFEDFVFFTRAGEASTIKIYKFTKTLQS